MTNTVRVDRTTYAILVVGIVLGCVAIVLTLASCARTPAGPAPHHNAECAGHHVAHTDTGSRCRDTDTGAFVDTSCCDGQ